MPHLDEFTLHPLTKADEPFLWEMLYQAIYVPPGSSTPPREMVHQPELSRYVQDWGQPTDLGFLAVEVRTHKPVGAAWLRLLTGENKGYGYTGVGTPELSIAVLPEYRRRGIGFRLLKALLHTAEALFPAVSLSVSPENPAVALYRRLGFEVVSERDAALTMRKTWEAE